MEQKQQTTEEMKKESIQDAVFARIDTEAVTPRSKYHFIFKDCTFWGFLILSIVIGSAAVAASFFTAMNLGWEFYEATHDNLFTFVIEALPYMWVVVLGITVFLGYYNIRHTKKGYKYPLWALLLISISGSVVGGTVLHGFGMSRAIDEGIGRHIPLHKPIVDRQKELWNQPRIGFVAGTVTALDREAEEVTITGFNGDTYTINTTNLRERDRTTLMVDKDVRIIGLKRQGGELHACHILPWGITDAPAPLAHIKTQRVAFLERVREGENDAIEESSSAPFALSERNSGDARTNGCRGVRPYTKKEKDEHRPRVLMPSY